MPELTGQVIVVGSINVDVVVRVAELPAPGETVGGGVLERHGGGKGANQAVAAARAGAQVVLVGAVGDDDFGVGAVQELRAEGIGCDGVAVLAGEATGLAAITVDAQGENQIAVASGANAALPATAVTRALQSLPSTDGAVMLLSFELEDEPLEAAATWARAAGIEWLVLNPAPARPLTGKLLGAAPVLTPNRGELRRLIEDGEDGVAATARALGARTGAAVIVTLGREGAIVADGTECRHHPAPEVRVRDTTGAGDAFNGVLAAALAQGHELDRAVALAVAGASASVQGAGARGGMPSRAEIDRLAAS